MTDSAALARQLAELDKMATHGPWVEDDGNFFDVDGNIIPFMGPYSGEEGSAYFERFEANPEMIVALRNNLPAILRALCVQAAVNSIRAESTAPFDSDDVQERANELLAELTGAK